MKLPTFANRSIAPTGILLVILTLWLPFGLGRIGLYEEWYMFWFRDFGLNLAFLTPQHILEFDNLLARPTSLIGYAIALGISPDSYIGFHVVLAGSIFMMALFAYYTLCRLTGRRALSWLIALLVVFFPADTALFAFRNLSPSVFSVGVWLFAVWLALVYQDNRKHWLLPLIWLSLALNLLMYEVGYPLILATPLLFLWRSKKLTRFLFWLIAAWWFVPLLTGLRLLWMIQHGELPQHISRLTGNMQLPMLIETIWAGLQRVFSRTFVEAWGEAWQQLLSSRGFLVYAVLITIVITGVGFWLKRREPMAAQPDPFNHPIGKISLILIGTLFVWLGFFVFSLSYDFLLMNNRTFLYPAFGAALVLGIAGDTLSRQLFRGRWFRGRVRVVGRLLLVLVVFVLCANRLLLQEQSYTDLSMIQKRVLGRIIEIAPMLKPDTMIIVVDDSGILNGESFWGYEGDLRYATRTFYGTSVVGTVCLPEPSFGSNIGQCVFQDRQLYINGGNSLTGWGERFYPYSNLVVFRFKAERTLELVTTPPPTWESSTVWVGYDPEARIDHTTPNARAKTMFACPTSINECTAPAELSATAHFFTDFDLRLEHYRTGRGWRETEYRDGVSFMWMDSQTATNNLLLSPKSNYGLRARILIAATPEQLTALRLSINGLPIPLVLSEDAEHAAIVTAYVPSWLVGNDPVLTQLVWSMPILRDVPNSSVKVGVAFDWIHIDPI